MMTPAKIRQLLASGMNQGELAKHIGVSQATVSRWVTKGSVPEPAHQEAMRTLYERRINGAASIAATLGSGAPDSPYNSKIDGKLLRLFAERVVRLVLQERNLVATPHEISSWAESSALLFEAHLAAQDR